jgi:hypothetical protein
MVKKEQLREGLSAAPSYENARCVKCGLCNKSYAPFLEPKIRGNIVFLLASPGQYDSYELGESYEWLIVKQVCELVGLDYESVSLATVTRCDPIVRKTIGAIPRTMCTPFLFHKLNDLTSAKLIAMGADAAKAIIPNWTTFDDVCGREFSTLWGQALITLSPREIFHEIKEEVMNVGVIDVICKHVENFLYGGWYTFSKLTEVE